VTPVRYTLAQRWLAFRRGIPWALLISGCTLSVVAARYVVSSSGAQMRSNFTADTEKMSSEIQLRLSSSVDVVRATAAILTADAEINAVEFRDFVTALHLPSHYPGMKGIGFARVVTGPSLPAFLRLTELDGNPLHVRPPGVRSEYIPVEVFEPHDGPNAGMVGLDLATNATARAAIERARDSGQPVVSEGVSLESPSSPGAGGTRLLLVPIYRREAALRTVAQRRRALEGFVLSTVAVDELLGAVHEANPSVQFQLYEGREATSAALRYSSDGAPRDDGFKASESVVVGGQPWLVLFGQTTSESGTLAQSARTTLGVGLALSILLFGFTRLQARAWAINAKHQLDLQQLALHDGLTGLANRALLEDQLPQAIAAAERRQRRLAVLFLDLDRFKEINDSLGHAVGDELLRSVAARLLACVRKSDTVSRHGGDEFVVLLTDIERVDHAADRAQEIINATGMPHRLGAHTIETSVSVGVSIYPDDGRNPTALLQAADAAMYQAKERGRNLCQFCTPEMNARAAARERVETGLRRALASNELELHYQPTIALESGRITGLEALIRWRDPVRGLLAPTEFVPIAEETGLIVQLGRWALRQACRQAQTWSDEGLPVTVAVNVSAVELRAKGFLDHARQILRETGLDPHRLELELTETVLMQRAPSTVDVLQSLRDLGVTIAIDDFGTGYSSVTYLRQFPIDVLKVDQSFVRDIPVSPDAPPIVSAMISMGQSLGHRVIAEGVETPEQHAFLLARQCGEGQGFYFSRPLPPDEMSAFMMASAAGVYLKA
jgi:diguanylate cyclase (GGDEF)-like protein